MRLGFQLKFVYRKLSLNFKRGAIIIIYNCRPYLILLISLSLISCVSVQAPQKADSIIPDETRLKQDYANSIIDAINVEPWEVSNQLTEISVDNPDLKWKMVGGDKFILVTSWKGDTSFYLAPDGSQFYNTGPYPIWVTIVPQVQKLCQKKDFGANIGFDMRLKQLFGLPPTDYKTAFIEFWVKPRDLFRPCPDPEISDTACSLTFPPDTDYEHRKWIDDLRATPMDEKYPWTQLGYTYDWNEDRDNHLGLSEFVISKNADVIIAGIHKTKDYCAR